MMINGHLLRPGPGSGPGRPDEDPDPAKTVQIRNTALGP
jgi:hypothetical protein